VPDISYKNIQHKLVEETISQRAAAFKLNDKTKAEYTENLLKQQNLQNASRSSAGSRATPDLAREHSTSSKSTKQQLTKEE
jgi:hypothetical protein